MGDDEFKRLLREGLAIEHEIVNLMSERVEGIKNSVVKYLLHGIVLDSSKHADTFQALIDLVGGVAMSEVEIGISQEVLRRHIKLEKDNLEKVEEIIDEIEDRGIRFMLQNIAADERRHHNILNRMLEISLRKEEIPDEKWWDFLYRFSRLTT